MTQNNFYINPRHEVSIRKAIIYGYLLLGVIPVCLIAGGFYIGIHLEESEVITNGQTGLVVLFSFVSGWLWWSVFVTKWKIWAFSRVRKVRKLKRKAIEDKLIWPDNSWFNKTEIATKNQRKQIAELNKRFEWERER